MVSCGEWMNRPWSENEAEGLTGNSYKFSSDPMANFELWQKLWQTMANYGELWRTVAYQKWGDDDGKALSYWSVNARNCTEKDLGRIFGGGYISKLPHGLNMAIFNIYG